MKSTKNDRRTDWLLRIPGSAAPRLRLFCLPHAGGGAHIFERWREHLPADIDLCAVRLPGRESRIEEEPYQDMGAVVAAMRHALSPWLDLPFAVFGHSMGAAIGHTWVLELGRDGFHADHLFVSGRRAPQYANDSKPLAALSDDQAFLAELQHRYQGIPDAVLREPELLAFLLPMIRADVNVSATAPAYLGERLDCALTVLGGDSDPQVPTEDLLPWQQVTQGPFQRRIIQGGHFFIESERAAVVRCVSAALASHLPPVKDLS